MARSGTMRCEPPEPFFEILVLLSRHVESLLEHFADFWLPEGCNKNLIPIHAGLLLAQRQSEGIFFGHSNIDFIKIPIKNRRVLSVGQFSQAQQIVETGTGIETENFLDMPCLLVRQLFQHLLAPPIAHPGGGTPIKIRTFFLCEYCQVECLLYKNFHC